MKAQISTVEMIISVIIIFIAFNILFSTLSFNSGWKDAYSSVEGRDILLSMDRTNSLAEYSFNTSYLQNFVNRMFPANDTILSTSVDGIAKSRLVLACNCTNETISELSYWMKDLKINNRNIEYQICYTNLEKKINPCFSQLNYPDVLLIWGYMNLSSYSNILKDFIAHGNGIVEIMDFTYQSNGNKIDSDPVQREIFGLKWVDIEKGNLDSIDKFYRNPTNTTDIIYSPYKYFYHVPLTLQARGFETISGCAFNPSPTGNITFNETIYKFWICDDTHAWFDTNGDSINDILKAEGENLIIGGYNFYLNYVDHNSVHLSFRPDFQFDDFLVYVAPPGEPEPPGKALGVYRAINIQPIDDNQNRILIKYVSTSPPREYPVVILNQTKISSVAWIADFSRNGLNKVKDDQKQLLNSLILSVSNKDAKELTYGSVKLGQSTSYLNVMNNDMFEIYKLNLWVGHPF
jgi:hypothetical protein